MSKIEKSTSIESTTPHLQPLCPSDSVKGKFIQIITLKSLLLPFALEQLDAASNYWFCASPNCQVVYFSDKGQTFTTEDLKVSVYQKNASEKVSVCYCFGWSRHRISEEIEKLGMSSVIASISAHMKAKRCGCEVNNPQGSCCIGNFRKVVEDAMSREGKT